MSGEGLDTFLDTLFRDDSLYDESGDDDDEPDQLNSLDLDAADDSNLPVSLPGDELGDNNSDLVTVEDLKSKIKSQDQVITQLLQVGRREKKKRVDAEKERTKAFENAALYRLAGEQVKLSFVTVKQERDKFEQDLISCKLYTEQLECKISSLKEFSDAKKQLENDKKKLNQLKEKVTALKNATSSLEEKIKSKDEIIHQQKIKLAWADGLIKKLQQQGSIADSENESLVMQKFTIQAPKDSPNLANNNSTSSMQFVHNISDDCHVSEMSLSDSDDEDTVSENSIKPPKRGSEEPHNHDTKREKIVSKPVKDHLQVETKTQSPTKDGLTSQRNLRSKNKRKLVATGSGDKKLVTLASKGRSKELVDNVQHDIQSMPNLNAESPTKPVDMQPGNDAKMSGEKNKMELPIKEVLSFRKSLRDKINNRPNLFAIGSGERMCDKKRMELAVQERSKVLLEKIKHGLNSEPLEQSMDIQPSNPAVPSDQPATNQRATESEIIQKSGKLSLSPTRIVKGIKNRHKKHILVDPVEDNSISVPTRPTISSTNSFLSDFSITSDDDSNSSDESTTFTTGSSYSESTCSLKSLSASSCANIAKNNSTSSVQFVPNISDDCHAFGLSLSDSDDEDTVSENFTRPPKRGSEEPHNHDTKREKIVSKPVKDQLQVETKTQSPTKDGLTSQRNLWSKNKRKLVAAGSGDKKLVTLASKGRSKELVDNVQHDIQSMPNLNAESPTKPVDMQPGIDAKMSGEKNKMELPIKEVLSFRKSLRDKINNRPNLFAIGSGERMCDKKRMELAIKERSKVLLEKIKHGLNSESLKEPMDIQPSNPVLGSGQPATESEIIKKSGELSLSPTRIIKRVKNRDKKNILDDLFEDNSISVPPTRPTISSTNSFLSDFSTTSDDDYSSDSSSSECTTYTTESSYSESTCSSKSIPTSSFPKLTFQSPKMIADSPMEPEPEPCTMIEVESDLPIELGKEVAEKCSKLLLDILFKSQQGMQDLNEDFVWKSVTNESGVVVIPAQYFARTIYQKLFSTFAEFMPRASVKNWCINIINCVRMLQRLFPPAYRDLDEKVISYFAENIVGSLAYPFEDNRKLCRLGRYYGMMCREFKSRDGARKILISALTNRQPQTLALALGLLRAYPFLNYAQSFQSFTFVDKALVYLLTNAPKYYNSKYCNNVRKILLKGLKLQVPVVKFPAFFKQMWHYFKDSEVQANIEDRQQILQLLLLQCDWKEGIQSIERTVGSVLLGWQKGQLLDVIFAAYLNLIVSACECNTHVEPNSPGFTPIKDILDKVDTFDKSTMTPSLIHTISSGKAKIVELIARGPRICNSVHYTTCASAKKRKTSKRIAQNTMALRRRVEKSEAKKKGEAGEEMDWITLAKQWVQPKTKRRRK